MKVTLRNTRILWYLSIVNPCLYILCVLFLPQDGFGVKLFPVMVVEFAAFALISLVYLIMVLRFFRESTAVVVAYTMFTVLFAITVVITAFPRLLGYGYTNQLYILLEVVGLLVAFRSFTVKAATISNSFKVLGIGMALMTIPRLMTMLAATSFNPDTIEVINDLGLLIILVALFLVLNKTLNYLKSGQSPETDILPGDEEEDAN